MTLKKVENIVEKVYRDRTATISIGIIMCILLTVGSALGTGFKVPITVNAAGFERFEKPVDVSVNFTQILKEIGHAGTIDRDSIHVAETNDTWSVIDASVPYQFDNGTGYNPTTKALGTVVFIMKGTTLSSASRYYYIYFDLIGGSSSPVVITPQVTLTDNVMDQGQSSYKVSAVDSTYYFQKAAGGFSSWDDKSGNDWISWNTANASAGKYRGIPNAVNPEEVFHPGFYCCTSTVVSQGPIKIRIKSVNGTKWESFWDFYPRYATMEISKVDHNYWFLYEGTPGGSLEINKDFMVRSNGVKTFLNVSWLGDIADKEWVYFSDPNVGESGRSLFLIHQEDDLIYEQYWSHTYMTVFGFGRKEANLTKLLSDVPQHFTMGLIDGTDFTQNSKLISSAYEELTITKGVAELDDGSVGPLSIVSSLPVGNPNTAINIAQTFSVNLNKKADVKWSMDGSVVQSNFSVSTSSYTDSFADVGIHNVNMTVKNGTDIVSKEWTWTINTGAVTDVQVTHHAGYDRQPMWSPDGQWLTFMTRGAGWEIRKSKLDGSSLTTLAGGAGGIEPAWGANNKIAFSRGVSDSTMDIFVMNNDGTNVQTLVDTPEYDEYPDWNKDATKIAFVSQWSVSNGNKYISTMNADGSNKKNLGVVGIQPAWSPDGTEIAFKCYLGGTNICITSADGTVTRQLTFNTVNTHSPDWSPDGHKIAYASSQDGDWEIYTININGTGKKQITSNVGVEDNYPAWSPDGKYIAYASNRSGDQEIWIMSVSGASIPSVLSIVSSSPKLDPTTMEGATQTFNISLNKNANIIWHIDNITVKTGTGSTSSYTNSTAHVGTYVVNVTATNGTDTVSKTWTWTVNPESVINLSVTSSSPSTNPSTIVGTSQTFDIGLNKNADIVWSIGGSVVQTDLNKMESSYTNLTAGVGTYVVNVTATNGTDTVSKTWTWTVNPEPVINLSIISSSPSINPSTIVGTSQTFSIGLNKNANITWSINGSVVKTDLNLQTSSYTNLTAGVGTYVVNVTATNGTDTVSKTWTWTVNPEPVPVLSIVSSSPSTNPSTIVGTSQTFNIGLNKNADIVWSIGGSVVQTDLNKMESSYTNLTAGVGTYVINVTATNGTDVKSKEWIWTVNPEPVINLSITSSSPSTNPSTIIGTSQTFNIGLNKNADIVWSIGGSVVQTDLNKMESSYTNLTAGVGTYVVSATATNGTDAKSKEWTWTVNPEPVPVLSIVSSSPNINPITIVGTSQTFNIGLNKNADIVWSIGGSVVQTDLNKMESSYTNLTAGVGTYIVNATATNGTDTVSKTWTWVVNPEPVPVLSIVSSSPNINPSTIVGTSQTFNIGLNKNADIVWSIGGSVVQTDLNKMESSYTNLTAGVGTYVVNATATNGTDTVSKTWTWVVNPEPVPVLSIVSSSPNINPSTIVGTSQTFNIGLNKNADIVWSIGGSVVQTDLNKMESSYTNLTAGVGTYVVNATATNGIDVKSKEWTWVVNPEPTIIYIPPVPMIANTTTGNFWVRYILQAGNITTGDNVTDGFNVSANGILINTTNPVVNITVVPHGKGKIIAYAYNNSGGISLTPVIQETQVPNNIPIQEGIGNIAASVGIEVKFTVFATDEDSDPINYSTNATRGTLDPVSGVYRFTPDSVDIGNHTWYYCSKDNYEGISCETIIVAVGGMSTLNTSITDPKNSTNVSFVNNIIQGIVTGTDIKSAILRIMNEANVVTNTYNLTLKNTKFAQRVEYSPSQKNTVELVATDIGGNISKTSMTINVGNDTYENIEQVNNNESITINAKNETGTEIVLLSNVTTMAAFRLTADTNAAEVAKLNNVTSNNSETALGRIVDIQADGLDTTNGTDVQNVTISMYYTKKDLDVDGSGVVETGELDEDKISFYWYDVNSSNWKKLSKGDQQWVVDSGIVKISGYNPGHAWIKVRHLSRYALAAGLVQSVYNGGNGGGSSSSSSGGSGGGAMGSSEDFNNIDVRERRDMFILKDVAVQYLFTGAKIPVTYINITGSENTMETSVLIELLKNTSSVVKTQAPGTVYKNLNIAIGMSKTAIPRYIKSVVVNFRVDNSWLDKNSINSDSIKMVKWNGKKWETIETSEKKKDDDYTYFESQTDDFSSFAIVGLGQISGSEKDTTGVKEIKASVKIGNNSAKPKTSNEDLARNVTGFEAIIGITAFVAIYISLRKKR